MLTAKNLKFFTPEKSSILKTKNPSHASDVVFTKIERLSNVLVDNLDRLGLKLESNPQQKFQLSHVSSFNLSCFLAGALKTKNPLCK